MALTKVSGGILDPGINVAGIVTATGFDGPFIGGGDGVNAGIGTFTGLDVNGNADISGNLVVGGNLTANGDFTTLNTTLREVEILRVDADTTAIAGIITQRGTGDILNLYDGSNEVFSVIDGGSVRIGDNASYTAGTGADDLVIGATTGQHGMTILTGNNSSSINFADSASSNAGAITYNHNGTNYMRFRVAGNERVRIQSGNVGIGTDDPTDVLDVYSNTDPTIRSRSGSSSVGANIEICGGSSNDSQLILSSGTTSKYQFFRDGSQSDDLRIYDSANSLDIIRYRHGAYLHFGVNGQERLRIDSSGRLLLNDISSRVVANINAQVQLEGTTANTSAISIVRNSASEYPPYLNFGKSRATSTGGTTIVNDNDSLGQIRFSGADGNDLTNHAASIEAFIDGTPGNNVTPGRLIFSTTSATGSDATEKFRISSNGQVCIGSGFVGGGGHLTIRGGGVNSYATQDYQYVGTPSDDDTLAQIRFTANTTGASVIQGAVIKAVADADWGASGDAPTRLEFHTAPDGSATMVNRMTITKDGRIGMHDSTPNDYELDIMKRSTATDANMRLYNNATGSNNDTTFRLHIAGTSANNYIYFGDGDDSNVGQIRYRHSNDSLIINTGAAERFTIDSAGITVTGEVAASQDYPNFRPTVDFNFTAEKKLDPRITYSRTGPASFTDEFGKVVLVGGNAPKFDHDPVTRESKGLLIEESRTNLYTYSSNLSSATGVWGNTRITVTVNTTTTPDKTNSASTLTVNSGGNYAYAFVNFTTNNGTSYALSGWFKYINCQYVWLLGGEATDIFAYFDIQNGTIGTTNGYECTITAYPDGWYRCTATRTKSGSTGSEQIGFGLTRSNNNPTDNQVGDAVYAWGAQQEVSAFPTSYIPTNGSTATRGADCLFMDGQEFKDFYNVVESSVVMQYSHYASLTNIGGSTRPFKIFASTGSDTRIDYVSTYNFHPYIAADGSAVVGAGGLDVGTPLYDGQTNKIAVKVKHQDFASTINGGTVGTNTSGSWPPTNRMDLLTLGALNKDGDGALNGHIQRFTYYPVGLTNNQLVTLTS